MYIPYSKTSESIGSLENGIFWCRWGGEGIELVVILEIKKENQLVIGAERGTCWC